MQRVPSESRIPALDGVRGIAILAVIAYHCVFFAATLASSGPAMIYERVVDRGYAGVDLFFVLSGFLITGILYDAKEAPRFFRRFYARRVLRIFPAYYLALVLCFLVGPAIFRALTVVPWRTQAYAWTYLSNLLLGQRGWDALPVYTGHFWSLAVEEQFYLAWPVLVFALTRRRLIGVCGAGLVMAVLARWWWTSHGNHLAAYLMTVARLDELAAGALLALASRGPAGLTRAARAAGAGVVVAVVAFAAVSWLPVPGLAPHAARSILLPVPIYGLASALILLAVTRSPASRVGRVLGAAPLRFFGKYSYALYLVHQPMILALRETSLAPRRMMSWRGGALGADLTFLALALTASVGVAWLSWRYWEEPFLRLRNRIQ